ncbi:MAG TPA: homoserine kinase [Actinomycetota bacterium]
MRVTVRVPATSANLGPGFDCFGLALDLCNEVTLDTDAEPGVEWHGEGSGELPVDGSDLVSRTIARVASARGVELPPARLIGHNAIPLERGLGSSAAATVAGVVLGSVLAPRAGGADLDRHEAFTRAAAIEGHPDNAAPAVFGGFTIAVPGGPVHRLDPHPGLRPVILVPTGVRLSTDEARAALPQVVSRDDAIFNAAHAALTVHALTHEPSLLAEAMLDRIHQSVRLALLPQVGAVFELLRDHGMAVCVSGSGPSLLAFETDDHALPELADGWQAIRVGVRTTGFDVSGR